MITRETTFDCHLNGQDDKFSLIQWLHNAYSFSNQEKDFNEQSD